METEIRMRTVWHTLPARAQSLPKLRECVRAATFARQSERNRFSQAPVVTFSLVLEQTAAPQARPCQTLFIFSAIHLPLMQIERRSIHSSSTAKRFELQNSNNYDQRPFDAMRIRMHISDRIGFTATYTSCDCAGNDSTSTHVYASGCNAFRGFCRTRTILERLALDAYAETRAVLAAIFIKSTVIFVRSFR